MPPTAHRLHRTARAAFAVVITAAMAACGGSSSPEQPSPNGGEYDADVIERDQMQRASTMYDLLVGRLPGVVVRKSGNSLSIQIRGSSSFHASTEALILVDGLEASGVQLAGINPQDVEKVEVLKDGAAAIYGVRGANGVLLVTTRRY